ncbi:MAG: efflux RND transporter periplasmic adaptor subunit [Planctomycetota bacterium]
MGRLLMMGAGENDQKTPSGNPDSFVFETEPSIDFSKRGGGTQAHYVAHDPRVGGYFRLGFAEYHVVTLLDGKRTLAEVCDQLGRDGVAWVMDDLIRFVSELAKHRIARVAALESPDNQTSEAVPQNGPAQNGPAQNAQGQWQLAIRLSSLALSQRIPLADGDRVASRLLPILGVFFTKMATVFGTLFIASGVAVVWSSGDAFAGEIQRIFDQPIWLFGLIWLLLKIIHECGHAVCAKHHGVRVGGMGVMFFLLAPLAYVDVTDAWKLSRRRDRVQIALAGVYLELLIGAAAAWIWWISPTGEMKYLAAQVFLVAGPATLLVNANPLLRLDGYYVLSDMLEIPNLRQHGRARIVGLIERSLFSMPGPTTTLRGWRSDFALAHGIASVVFQIAWMTGLIIAVGRWMKGLGVLLATLAIAIWCILPLVKWMHKVWTHLPRNGWGLTLTQRRLLATCGLVAVVTQYVSLHNSPFARRVPVVVRFQNEQIVRAPTDAFVQAVLVECGQRVDQGQLLVVLSQPELVVKRQRWIDQRDLERSKAIQHRRRSEIAMANAALDNAASLDRKIREIADQLAELRVVAARDGIVSTPRVSGLTGSYIRSGDEIIRVCDPHEKELLAIIDESDVDSYRQAVKQNAVGRVRFRGGVSLQTPLCPLQPAASRVLPHEALAATSGGPLALEPDPNSSESRLVQPQLQSALELDALRSLKVQAGQVGRLTIPDSQSLLSRVWQSFDPSKD